MFPQRYYFAWQNCEGQFSLGFPPKALPFFNGTIRPSDCLYIFYLPSSLVRYTMGYAVHGIYRPSPVDTVSLYDMADLRPRGAAFRLTNTTTACCLPPA